MLFGRLLPREGNFFDLFNQHGDQIVASGALVSGLDAVGSFTTPQTAPGTTDGSFGGTAIGPGGQVMVTSVLNRGNPDSGPDNWIRVNLDPDGAAALNRTFGVALPTDGSLQFGTATVTLR